MSKFDIIVLTSLFIFTFIETVLKKKVLRACLILIVLGTMAFREFAAGSYVRLLIEERQIEQTYSEQYGEGALDMMAYYDSTCFYIYAGVLNLMLLYFSQTKKEEVATLSVRR